MDVFENSQIMSTGLEPMAVLILCIISFLASLITASMGVGGGMLMLAVMALYVSPSALIPLHGAIQLGSNSGRALLLREHIMTQLLPAFLLGSIIGALIGGQMVVTLPAILLESILAVFILYVVWAPKFKVSRLGKNTLFLIGGLSSFVTMFVGATGPLLAPFIAASSDTRQQLVATHAIMMTLQNILKLFIFGLLGFSFQEWLFVLMALLACGFIGTWVGKKVLNRMPEPIFRNGLKIVLTLIALKILWEPIQVFSAF